MVRSISFHLTSTLFFFIITSTFSNTFSVRLVENKVQLLRVERDRTRRNYYRFIKVIHALPAPAPISHQTNKALNYFNGVVAKMVLIDSMFEFDLGDIDFQSFHRDNSFWVALQAARISNFNNTKLLQRFLLAAPSRY